MCAECVYNKKIQIYTEGRKIVSGDWVPSTT